MSPESFALAVAVVMFVGGLLGLVLQRALPEHHTTGSSRDMIGAIVGLLTLLCALVTGLLIWTAYGVYAGQNITIQTLASKVLQLDLALEDYGPDAKPERLALRDRVGKTIDQIWGAKESDANFAANSFAAAICVLREPEKALERTRALNGRAEARSCHSKIGYRINRPVAASDELCSDRSSLLSASFDRRRLGILSFLRLRSDVARRGHARHCFGRRRHLGRDRRPNDPRPFQPLFRGVPCVPGSAGTSASGDGEGVKRPIPQRARRGWRSSVSGLRFFTAIGIKYEAGC